MADAMCRKCQLWTKPDGMGAGGMCLACVAADPARGQRRSIVERIVCHAKTNHELAEEIRRILGDVTPEQASLGYKSATGLPPKNPPVPPMAHPHYPWLFASRIEDIDMFDSISTDENAPNYLLFVVFEAPDHIIGNPKGT